MKHRFKPRIAALFAFCVVIILFIGLEYLECQRYHETLQTRTIDRLSQIRARLESEINANFYLTRGLIAYVSTHPEMDDRTFQRLSHHILAHQNYIRNIALAPDNTIRFIYPLQGNESALGTNYKNIPGQWPSVERVIASRKTVIAGPVHLIQGGIAFISRTPIYIAPESGNPAEERYWGLASIVIEKELLFQAAGLYAADLETVIAIRGKDGLGSEGELIEGDPAIFQNNPVLLPVNLPEGSWQLAALPVGGWQQTSPNLAALRILGFVFASIIGLICYFWLHHQETIHLSLETAWQQAEKARADLRLHEEFLDTVIDNIPAMIFVKDARDLRFLRLNQTGAELLGYAVSDFLGKNDFDFFPESEARFFADKDREVLEEGKLLDIPEEPVQTRNNGRKILHTRKIPVFDHEGKPLYLLGISVDITEQISAKAEKEHLEKLLQQAQKLETIGNMAGGVAHDLNNILSGIINYPELLLLKLPQDSPLRKPLEDIHNSGKRAANVVADLLTIARGVAAVRENASLPHLVEEYLQSPEHRKLLSSSPRITYTLNLECDLWTISCTPVHIRKCLMNLINNAAEAFDTETGGEIVISGRNEELELAIPGFPDVGHGRYVILSVQDNGKGITANDLDHIFEPFYTKKAMGRSGTGLGLTVIWNTMKDHQGAVTVESSPGKGTIFSLYLPAVKGEAATHPATTAIEDLYGQGQTILIVDDEPHQRDIASKILQHLRYTVRAVASGEEAIEHLKSHTVELVILDMIMHPGMNGRETYEAIIVRTPGQKAIIASGYAENEEVMKLQTLGAGQYVKKPYTLEQLGSAVQQALG
jgi:PAS domain S-box-containing protein